MAGLRFDSLADMPEGMRKLAADKIVAGTMKQVPTVGATASSTASGPPSPEGKANKYRNVEVEVDGIHFQSKKEARRYEYLCRAVELGVIEDLRLRQRRRRAPDFDLKIYYL